MKRAGLILMALVLMTSPLFSQMVTIPDPGFLNLLIVRGVDKNGDGQISNIEAEAVTLLSDDQLSITDPIFNDTIRSLKGIDAFVNLEILFLRFRGHQLPNVDLSSNGALREIDFSQIGMESLDVSKCLRLEILKCEVNRLTSLDVSNNLALKSLWCGVNRLTSLDVSNNLFLKELNCGRNDLTSLDISNNIDLVELGCGIMQLTSLDLSNNMALEVLSCNGNELRHLDVSYLSSLEILWCGSNNLTGLDVSKNSELKTLAISNCYCSPHNPSSFTSLDVSKNTKLEGLLCCFNDLTTLDVSKNPELRALTCGGNLLTTLDLSNNLALVSLNCSGNLLTSLDLSNNRALSYFSSLPCSSGLELYDMPTLHEVCVWELPFPPTYLWIDTSGSPNLYFSDCGAPEFITIMELFLPESVYISISENGSIYAVPGGTEKDIAAIREICIDSIVAPAGNLVRLYLSAPENKVYWLYARDSTGNISEPEAFTIEGVGIENDLSEQFRIFPNPVQDQLIIETNGISEWVIELTSLNGQIIYNSVVESDSHQIDLSSYQNGVYFITVRSEDFVTTQKIIKL